MKAFRMLSAAALAGVLMMGLASPAARGEVVVDEQFTSNPTDNGWKEFSQGGKVNGEATVQWDKESNVKLEITANPGKGYRLGLVKTAPIDLSKAQTVTLRMTFGKSDGQVTAGGNNRIVLFSSANPAALKDVEFLMLAVQGSGVAITKQGAQFNQPGTRLVEFQSSGKFTPSNPRGGIGQAGDWVEVTYSRQNIESVSYFDADGNNGQGKMLSALEKPVAHGLDFDKAFAKGAYVAIEKFGLGGKENTTTTLIVDEVRVSTSDEAAK